MPPVPEPDYQALYGKLVEELRALRKKQARLRHQVRHMQERLTVARLAMKEALAALEAEDPQRAAEELRRASNFAKDDPNRWYTPPGAKRRTHDT